MFKAYLIANCVYSDAVDPQQHKIQKMPDIQGVFKDPLGTVNEIQFFTNRIASYRTVFTMLEA